MVNQTVKEKVRGKLLGASTLASDIKQSKIKTRIGGIEKIDGKLSATFCISGLPTSSKKDTDYFPDSYRDIQKIFDDWKSLSSYAEDFLNKTDEEIIKLAKE